MTIYPNRNCFRMATMSLDGRTSVADRCEIAPRVMFRLSRGFCVDISASPLVRCTVGAQVAVLLGFSSK